jgi:MFS family permease
VSVAVIEPHNADESSVRRDFGLLWAGQSLSLFGDQFAKLALPLVAVIVLHVSPARATLLPFALFVPFLVLGLPAGAIVERLSRRSTMLISDGVQMIAFGAIWLLLVTGRLSFPLLSVLVLLAGCATVFFQVAYTSYLPSVFRDPGNLHVGNARLALSESTSKALGPMAAGPLIRMLGLPGVIAANAFSFAASVMFLSAIRHRDKRIEPTQRERGWIRRDIWEGLKFAWRHPILQPILACGTTYVLFLSMIDVSLVLYCRNILGLSTQWIGVVVGAAAAGYPIGNMLSARLIRKLGAPTTLVISAVVSVAGIVAMPAATTLGRRAGVVGLIFGSIVHCIGEGVFSPTGLTLRQTQTPAELLGRTSAVQRFALWGAVAVGSLLAAGVTAETGLAATIWIGALGTTLCLPALLQRGIRAALGRSAQSHKRPESEARLVCRDGCPAGRPLR